MIELLWVSDAGEVRSELVKRPLLWERWSGRHGVLRPLVYVCVPPIHSATDPPFPAWEYRPTYLPDPLFMHIAETGVEEPMWVYLSACGVLIAKSVS